MGLGGSALRSARAGLAAARPRARLQSPPLPGVKGPSARRPAVPPGAARSLRAVAADGIVGGAGWRRGRGRGAGSMRVVARPINLLLLAGPLGFLSIYMDWGAIPTFALLALAIIPLAGLTSGFTDAIADQTGSQIG